MKINYDGFGWWSVSRPGPCGGVAIDRICVRGVGPFRAFAALLFAVSGRFGVVEKILES